jgi:hypothetical protein
MKHTYKNPTDDILWIANIKKIRLDKNYCITSRDAHGKTYKIFWGKGLPLYSYSLRTNSGRTISTEYVRAKSIHHVLSAAREYWPTIQGVKDL